MDTHTQTFFHSTSISYVQPLDRVVIKTGIPALGELPVQLTDALTQGFTLEAHRDT